MDILVNVSSQKLRIPTNMRNIVERSQKFVHFVFNLSSDWDDLTAFAQFQQNGKSYNVYLDKENKVSLPYEIKTGECSVMLYGTDDEIMTPTNAYKFNVQINELVEDGESHPGLGQLVLDGVQVAVGPGGLAAGDDDEGLFAGQALLVELLHRAGAEDEVGGDTEGEGHG